MIPFAALVSAVFAGAVYINGVRADLLPEVTLKNTTVRFDAQGNVWVEAPGYNVQVLPPVEYSRPVPSAVGSGDASVSYRVTPGEWWMVTEDNGSHGQVLDILVNGELVRRIRSGEPQLILDIGPHLRPGPNVVVIGPVPGTNPSGETLSVYIGRGSSVSGTIHLDNPEVAYSRRGAEGGAGTRQYTITIP